jgi:hypothetical protein
MTDSAKRRRRWVLPAALVVAGVLMMVIGAFWPGGYASAVWLQVGSAFALFGPLFWAQKRLERGITEVRQEGRQTRSSVQQLSHEVEAIRAQTAATLDDLREVTLEQLRQRRETDEDAFRRFREDPTFENVTRLLDGPGSWAASRNGGFGSGYPAPTSGCGSRCRPSRPTAAPRSWRLGSRRRTGPGPMTPPGPRSRSAASDRSRGRPA